MKLYDDDLTLIGSVVEIAEEDGLTLFKLDLRGKCILEYVRRNPGCDYCRRQHYCNSFEKKVDVHE